jgi:hypothetical protein
MEGETLTEMGPLDRANLSHRYSDGRRTSFPNVVILYFYIFLSRTMEKVQKAIGSQVQQSSENFHFDVELYLTSYFFIYFVVLKLVMLLRADVTAGRHCA